MDQLERIIRSIVEGQLRSFVNDHPEVLDAVNWYKPRDDKRKTFVNSVSKRIVRDLTSPTTRGRLAAALVALYCEGSETQGCNGLVGLREGMVELATATPPETEAAHQ